MPNWLSWSKNTMQCINSKAKDFHSLVELIHWVMGNRVCYGIIVNNKWPLSALMEMLSCHSNGTFQSATQNEVLN